MSVNAVDEQGLVELREAALGPVLAPGDEGYEEARGARLFNGAYAHRRPGVIVRCMGVADVQLAIAFAAANSLPIAVRGGGHSPSGSSTIDGGVLLDMGLMHGVHVDPERRVAVVGPGTLLSELDRETQVHGLAAPAGVVSHTGVAGLTLGGGVGRLMRKHGLTVDNVRGFDIVTADGQWRHVDAEDHPDLFWALRGGGGQLGIVTSFEFDLHPVGPIVLGGSFGWPLTQAKEVYEALREEIAAAPDDLALQLIFVTGPRAEFIPEELRGQPTLMMPVTWLGEDAAEGERVIAPFRERVPPALDMVGPIPYTLLQSASDVLAPHGRRGSSLTGYLAELDDELIDIAIDLAERFPTDASVLEFSQMGGAVNRVPADATAASAFRDAGFFYIAGANSWDEADDEPGEQWVREADAALATFRLPGRYINFLTYDDDASLPEAIGEQTFSRLAEVKAKYDPQGLFAHNPNGRRQGAPAGS
jgi:FAD/FMN-containing dehydrogenase